MELNFLKPNLIEIDVDSLGKQKIQINSEKVAFCNDIILKLKRNNEKVDVFLSAKESFVSHIYLTYDISLNEDVLVFGDAIERGYGDMGWFKLNPDRQMFWYGFIKDKLENKLVCFGVDVQPNSIVSFYVDKNTFTIDINTQSGGCGVNLDGREVHLCSLNFKSVIFSNLTDSIKDFLRTLMGDIKIKKTNTKIYGFNNWYYAYGESSFDQIMKDTLLLEELTKDIDVIPYMVIDDGWSVNACAGPWSANNKFNDMALLASKIKKHRAIPGIWFRPLKDETKANPDNWHPLRNCLLDPTLPSTVNQIKEDVSIFVKWGYKLIKFDFITVDLYINYGFEMDKNLCQQGWSYKDNHFTNAEILKNLYLAIREAAGEDIILIGCNAIGHLCAGICELNRTGDDTSGFEWERTRKYGVNSLAYRLYQDDVFYKIDGDCVGIMDRIPWEQNKLWLDILSKSNSPLFVSCNPDLVNEEIKNDLRIAFKENVMNEHRLEAVEIDETLFPSKWDLDSKIISYDWYIINK